MPRTPEHATFGFPICGVSHLPTKDIRRGAIPHRVADAVRQFVVLPLVVTTVRSGFHMITGDGKRMMAAPSEKHGVAT
jgi:hypothetical protein